MGTRDSLKRVPVGEFNAEYARKRQVEAEIALHRAIDAGKALAEACADYRNELKSVMAYLEHMGLTGEFDEWVRENG